jgi:mannose-1-phosphate guanylyltransferase
MRADDMAFVIMAGGAGTRFWPLSRETKPKQFLNIIGQGPLIEETFLRISSLADEERVYVVINRAHRELTRDIFKDRGIQILEEPYGRNTAPCIGVAAIHIKRRWGDIPVVVLPADHFIGDGELFRTTLRAGIELSQRGGIVTIGIPPGKPETGYGYIKRGRRYDSINGQEVFEVDRFVEKPDEKRALQYMREGNYLWNSGIFIFRVEVFLNEVRKYRGNRRGSGWKTLPDNPGKGLFKPGKHIHRLRNYGKDDGARLYHYGKFWLERCGELAGPL